MKAKLDEQKNARKLRQEGYSINRIAKELGVSKGSVSSWVRHIAVDAAHRRTLHKNSHSPTAIENRRQSRLASEKKKRDFIIEEAKCEIGQISRRELWLIGTMLYWAEGGKTQRMVRFSNGDPEMIQVMVKYFVDICSVPRAKIKGHIYIHDHLDVSKAEKYWQDISEIPKKQFYKTYRRPKTASKRTTLPYGVMDIYILDVKLFLKIQGWTRGVFEAVNLPD